MKIVTLLVATLTAALLALGVAFVVGMRRKTPTVLNAVRRSGRAMKPLVLRSAGTSGSPTAVVEHVGRKSGRQFETPVVATPMDGGFVVALPYGQNTDWLKNVTAAGGATIRFSGERYDTQGPTVVDLRDVEAHFAPKEQRQHRRFRVREALVLRTTADSSPARPIPSANFYVTS